MAFGDQRTPFTGSGASTLVANDLTGSVAVSVGDLVYVAFGNQDTLTASGVTDNLGNTYTALNAGTDAGVATLRIFYTIITSAGTLTTVTVAATNSTRDYAAVAAIIEGPFADPGALDANPSNAVDDLTSPFTCPATGTLAQADEVVMSAIAANSSGAFSATSPNVLVANANLSTTIRVGVGCQLVSATSSVAPEFTGSNPSTNSVLATTSFKKAAGGGGSAMKLQGGNLTASRLVGGRLAA